MREPFPPSIVDVKCLGLKPFSRLFDRSFNFPRAALYFLLLVQCTLERLSLEGACDKTYNSSDRFFHYLGTMSVEQVTEYCNVLLRRSFKILWMNRWHHRRVLLAIDTSDMPYDGKDTEYVHYTIKKRGLKINKVKVLRFASVCIVAGRFKITLAIQPVRKKEKMESVVKRLVMDVPGELKVRAVLMDKGFYYTGVFKTMEQLGFKYIIPVKQYKEMDLFYHTAEVTGIWRWKYTMNQTKRKNRGDAYTFNVYLQDVGVEDYMGFASNLDMDGRDFDTLMQAYRYRWNAENGYKESKEYKIKTNSRNHGYRVLAYTISHLMMNLQNITRRNNKNTLGITVDQMKEAFKLLLTFKHATKRLTKRLIIIY
jgi:hypothetical protein